ncbi:hypothetical protein H310_06700 [Aphanomyces invadans]|uniref:Uncharacterized protein n=1 Tax=Aphanomyces invadans TaxID=157072 RepID=A0A024U637_9STRA|nr:hypothetical protein H310_06700 [Aphanomyces invadans]ETW01073.1 hypothetical protein H310_06700 [Aphanomyces invadans]|eukprot:XP_008870071.1 hypothetical protein H310_06700 [Aphanomyces invadans]
MSLLTGIVRFECVELATELSTASRPRKANSGHWCVSMSLFTQTSSFWSLKRHVGALLHPWTGYDPSLRRYQAKSSAACRTCHHTHLVAPVISKNTCHLAPAQELDQRRVSSTTARSDAVGDPRQLRGASARHTCRSTSMGEIQKPYSVIVWKISRLAVVQPNCWLFPPSDGGTTDVDRCHVERGCRDRTHRAPNRIKGVPARSRPPR